jgi:hypothetical protein
MEQKIKENTNQNLEYEKIIYGEIQDLKQRVKN